MATCWLDVQAHWACAASGRLLGRLKVVSGAGKVNRFPVNWMWAFEQVGARAEHILVAASNRWRRVFSKEFGRRIFARLEFDS